MAQFPSNNVPVPTGSNYNVPSGGGERRILSAGHNTNTAIGPTASDFNSNYQFDFGTVGTPFASTQSNGQELVLNESGTYTFNLSVDLLSNSGGNDALFTVGLFRFFPSIPTQIDVGHLGFRNPTDVPTNYAAIVARSGQDNTRAKSSTGPLTISLDAGEIIILECAKQENTSARNYVLNVEKVA